LTEHCELKPSQLKFNNIRRG